jgi:transitional endoplasmic reticulum ATPase
MDQNIVQQLAEALQQATLPASKRPNWDRLDVEIKHEGRAITLPGDPANMPEEKAVEALQRKIADNNQPFVFREFIDNGHPFDAAVAFVKAMTKLYGWASPQTVMTMFGPKPPQMLSIKTGHGIEDVIQCPFGAFKLPGIDNLVHTMWDGNNKGQMHFLVFYEGPKKAKHILLELITEARRILREESIYRGKAIRFSVDSDGDVDLNSPPEFMDVSDTSEADLIFDADIQAQIDTSILVPIKDTAACRKHKIPLKRGVLLEGPYGTGKSLTARMTAAVCEKNGWTFVLLDRVQGLRTALDFANQYAPAVVFAEDIDRIAAERDEEANDLINTIDGVVSKRSEIMTILTTNFADKLNPVILRPGRLDAVISLRAPSHEAVGRLLRSYAGKLLADGESTERAAIELSGQIPASIRECVERAKLGMIGRGAKTLSDSDLVIAAKTMKNHLALLNKKVDEETDAQRLADSLRKVIAAEAPDLDELESGVRVANERINMVRSRTSAIHESVAEVGGTALETKNIAEKILRHVN